MAREPSHGDRVVTLISLLRRTTQLMVDEITVRLDGAGFPNCPPSFHPIFENLDPEGTRLTVLAGRPASPISPSARSSPSSSNAATSNGCPILSIAGPDSFA